MNDEDPPRGTDEDEDLLPTGRSQSARRSKSRSRSARGAGADLARGASAEDRGSSGADTGQQSDRVFIAGVEAAVAAGLADDEEENGYRRFEPEPPPASFTPPDELLDWTEPPTGQVPRILLRDDEEPDSGAPATVKGPVWREQGTDWDDDTDLSHLTDEGEAVIPASGGSIDDEDPFEFEFEYTGRLAGRGRGAGADLDPDESRSAIEDTNPNPVVYGPSVPTESTESEPAISWQSWAGSGAAGGSVLGEPAPGSEAESEDAGSGDTRPVGRRHAQRRGGTARPAATTEELAPASRMRRRPRIGATRPTTPTTPTTPIATAPAAATAQTSGGASTSTSTSRGIPAVTSSTIAGAGGATTSTESGRSADDIRLSRTTQAPSGPGRNVGIAILTGVGIGVVAIICFLLGSVATLALSTIAVTAAGAECFAGMRRAGYRPATLVGLIGIPTLLICSYLKGSEAVEIVVAIFTVVTLLWYLAGVSREDPVSNIGATLAGFLWVGLLGSFAGLLLAPSLFPRGNGVALFVGAVVPTVGYDTAAFAAGAWFGKHKMAPTISPGKTWEGFFAGAAAAIILAAAVISQIKPWTLSSAIGAGFIIAVLAPIGDLVESMFKRSLGLKDMGSLLPAHGGVLDRIDALLFVLPALYIFVRIAHIT